LHRDTEPVAGYFADVLRDLELLRLDGGIFALHCILTASFVVLPLALRDHAGLAASRHGWVYLPVLLVSMVVMIPLVLLAEKRRRLKEVFLAAVLAVAVAELGFYLLYDSLVGIVAGLLVFFIAFNLLEALLPSLLAKAAPGDKKGTAMGVFSTAQFLGAFTGGVAGGWMHGRFGLHGVFGFCLVSALAWFLWARSMVQPRYLTSYMISVGEIDAAEADRRTDELGAVAGVAEVVIVADEGVAYLKIDSRTVDHEALETLERKWHDIQLRRSMEHPGRQTWREELTRSS
jgi:MFS family permease